MSENNNSTKKWLYVLLIGIVLYAIFKDKKTITAKINDPETSKTSNVKTDDSVKLEEQKEKLAIQKKEIQEKEKQDQKKNIKRKYNQDKNRVIDCLVGSFKGDWGTYTFYSNGFFSWEVSSGPYQQYREGKWKYIGNNKVKVYKDWIGKSTTITVSKYCEIFGLN